MLVGKYNGEEQVSKTVEIVIISSLSKSPTDVFHLPGVLNGVFGQEKSV